MIDGDDRVDVIAYRIKTSTEILSLFSFFLVCFDHFGVGKRIPV